MAKVITSATLWPALQHQVRNGVRELIRDWAAPRLGRPSSASGRISFELMCKLYTAFRRDHPALDVDYLEFRAEVNHLLGFPYWLVIRRSR